MALPGRQRRSPAGSPIWTCSRGARGVIRSPGGTRQRRGRSPGRPRIAAPTRCGLPGSPRWWVGLGRHLQRQWDADGHPGGWGWRGHLSVQRWRGADGGIDGGADTDTLDYAAGHHGPPGDADRAGQCGWLCRHRGSHQRRLYQYRCAGRWHRALTRSPGCMQRRLGKWMAPIAIAARTC